VNRRAIIAVLAGLWALAQSAVRAEEDDKEAVRFRQSAPYSSDAEIARRFGYRMILPEYDVSGEKFRMLLPEGFSTNSTWGLLVWISPGNDAYVPSDWLSELSKRRLIVVSAYNSGNDRHPIDRIRLALDATCNVCRKLKIERRRIYISGFSGGARIASMIGIACGDLFTGTLCICGVNFYRNVRAGPGQFYQGTFFPNSDTLQYARDHARYVLLTGDGDPNRDNTKAIADKGFKPESFKHVLYLEEPGLQHALPAGSVLGKALDYLDGVTPAGG
jgi:hypothetical protein